MRESFTILIIDDDQDDKELFCLILKRISEKVHCRFAADAIEGLYKLTHHEMELPDLVLVDMNMPKMTGTECIRQIKKMARLDHIPVYLISTADNTKLVNDCIAAGATGFIKKDARIANIEESFRKLLGERGV